ncbi:MAG: succinylglutamate-semialdehyde dehydrogenase [Bdellovibrionales bacterium]|nr:succinylglutamate-semialdehyde dehydrogenase [Bdellovibrionales bacterium]
MEIKTLSFLGDYIDGEFVRAQRPDKAWTKKSPSDLKDEVIHMECKYEHVDQACRAAKDAFQLWADLKPEERFQYLNRLKEVYIQNKEQLATVIARETGKPMWESLTEAQAMIGKIDITINDSVKLISQQIIPEALPGVEGRVVFKPRGVMAVLGPYNFPGHLPNGHIIPALATGNTIVFKPSEWTPATGQLMADLFDKAEFPKGVFNLVQGEGETGKRLSKHELVDGILFTGSYETGLRIEQETLTHFWKLRALEMGGKNASVVWKDADLKKAIYENLVGSFISCGQRCSCTSRIILHKDIAQEFIDKFYDSAKKIVIGHWKNNPFMGPLINEDSVEKYIRFQGMANREGAENLMRGKPLDLTPAGYYVTPSIHLVPEFKETSVYQKTEIFGPNVAIYTVDDYDQAMEINNSTGFGLVMSLFSKDENLYERAMNRAKVGLVNWNRSTVGASSKLPFGGMGKSGNGQPSASFAVYYCTVPVATLVDPTEFDQEKILPGISY